MYMYIHVKVPSPSWFLTARGLCTLQVLFIHMCSLHTRWYHFMKDVYISSLFHSPKTSQPSRAGEGETTRKTYVCENGNFVLSVHVQAHVCVCALNYAHVLWCFICAWHTWICTYMFIHVALSEPWNPTTQHLNMFVLPSLSMQTRAIQKLTTFEDVTCGGGGVPKPEGDMRWPHPQNWLASVLGKLVYGYVCVASSR